MRNPMEGDSAFTGRGKPTPLYPAEAAQLDTTAAHAILHTQLEIAIVIWAVVAVAAVASANPVAAAVVVG